MKRKTKFGAAALLILAVLTFAVACTNSNSGGTTPKPSAMNTTRPTSDAGASPSVAPAGSGAPVSGAPASGMPTMSGASSSPDMSMNPSQGPASTAGMTGNAMIDGFMQGKVVAPEDIPEITALIGREFPDYSVQSVTHELFDGRQTYRIVLQGKGELSRMVYVSPNGTIIIPNVAD